MVHTVTSARTMEVYVKDVKMATGATTVNSNVKEAAMILAVTERLPGAPSERKISGANRAIEHAS